MMAEYISTTTIKKSRKLHRCHACGDHIQKGSSYSSTLFRDDNIYSIPEHLWCNLMGQSVLHIDEGMSLYASSDGLSDGWLREWMNECVTAWEWMLRGGSA